MSESSEVLASYVDVFGNEKAIDPGTRLRARAGARPPKRARRRKAAATAGRCHQPELLERGGRAVGLRRAALRPALGAQLGHRRLQRPARAGRAGRAARGAALVGVNPLHATRRQPVQPVEPPRAQLALPRRRGDSGVRRVEEGARAGCLERVPASASRPARSAELVDYRARRRREARGARAAVQGERSRARPARARRARATRCSRRCARSSARRWQAWPEAYRDPGSAEVGRFARKHAGRVDVPRVPPAAGAAGSWTPCRRARRSWACRSASTSTSRSARIAGGAEVWADQQAYALDVSCGAPPDEFNPRGQDWGLPPYSPRALRATGCAAVRASCCAPTCRTAARCASTTSWR